MIRLLLVDNQSLFCQGLKTVLSLEPDLQVVGVVDHAETAVEQVAALQPDVVLMDVQMLVTDGGGGYAPHLSPIFKHQGFSPQRIQ